jgi:transposase
MLLSNYFNEEVSMDISPVAGIDVGKYFSEMIILAPTNEVYAHLKFDHNLKDINKVISLLKRAGKDFNTPPMVVMESTGHYHKILFHSLHNSGFEIIVTNPIQTDSIKNIGIRKVKNDKSDAKKIALLYRFQSLKTTNIPSEDIDCLRTLCRQYYILSDELTAYKNRLIGVVDQIMLNFTSAFKDVACNSSLAILENYPTPKDILNADKDRLVSLIQKASKRNLKWANEKYEILCLKAKEFEPLSLSTPANLIMLDLNISMVRKLGEALDKVLSSIHAFIREDAAKDLPALSMCIELLRSIPGIDTLSAATILSEIGDFSAFSKPGKLVAYFGIDPSVNQSGQFVGTCNKISKRGPRLLRRVLFTTVLANIRRKCNGEMDNPVLYDFYKAKCISKPKMVAIVAVMHKLVSIIFAVLRDKKPFVLRTPEEHAQMLKSKALLAV